MDFFISFGIRFQILTSWYFIHRCNLLLRYLGIYKLSCSADNLVLRFNIVSDWFFGKS